MVSPLTSERECLGAVVSDKGSKEEIMSRIAQTLAAMKRLKTIWNEKNITLKSKIRLMRALVISTFLYACESWTLTADLEKRIQATEMRCFRNILGITYKVPWNHVQRSLESRTKTMSATKRYGTESNKPQGQDLLNVLATVKKRKQKDLPKQSFKAHAQCKGADSEAGQRK